MPRWLPALLIVSVLVLVLVVGLSSPDGRWPALLVISLVVLALAVYPILFPGTNPNLTRENLDRIKPGMRRQEVEAILGQPGDYRTGPTRLRSMPLPAPLHDDSLTGLCWKGNNAEIQVWLGPDGVLSGNHFVPMEPKPVGVADRLLWRFHRWRESRA